MKEEGRWVRDKWVTGRTTQRWWGERKRNDLETTNHLCLVIKTITQSRTCRRSFKRTCTFLGVFSTVSLGLVVTIVCSIEVFVTVHLHSDVNCVFFEVLATTGVPCGDSDSESEISELMARGVWSSACSQTRILLHPTPSYLLCPTNPWNYHWSCSTLWVYVTTAPATDSYIGLHN